MTQAEEENIWDNAVDRVYYINLPTRVQREKEIQSELQKMLINPFKIQKVYASFDKRGFMGCTKSHIRVLQMALASALNTIIVFEDDFQLCMDIEKSICLINRFWKTFPDANVLMLQANPISVKPTTLSGISKVRQAYCTAGYMVKGSYIPTLLQSFQDSFKRTKPLDVIPSLQTRDNWYCLQPPMGKQRASFSDIEQRHVHYGV